MNSFTSLNTAENRTELNQYISEAVTRRLCRLNYFEFVKEFWSVIINETPIWNWHIKYLCDEIQAIIERLVHVSFV